MEFLSLMHPNTCSGFFVLDVRLERRKFLGREGREGRFKSEGRGGLPGSFLTRASLLIYLRLKTNPLTLKNLEIKFTRLSSNITVDKADTMCKFTQKVRLQF